MFYDLDIVPGLSLDKCLLLFVTLLWQDILSSNNFPLTGERKILEMDSSHVVFSQRLPIFSVFVMGTLIFISSILRVFLIVYNPLYTFFLVFFMKLFLMFYVFILSFLKYFSCYIPFVLKRRRKKIYEGKCGIWRSLFQ